MDKENVKCSKDCVLYKDCNLDKKTEIIKTTKGAEKRIKKHCHYCNKVGLVGHKENDILFIYNMIDKKRYPTCRACHRDLSRKGISRCIAWVNHHLGSVCKICGQKN
jgi:hypothetical protein